MAELHPALLRLPLTEQRLEERRLARPVRADERDVLAALEDERGAVEQELVPGRDDEVVRLEDDAAGAGGAEELEAERAPLARQRLELPRRGLALLLQPADLAQLGLRLLRLRLLVAEPRHEALEALDVVTDPVELRRRRRGARGLLAAPLVPGAVEEERLGAAELEHGRRHGLEEPAVVGDEDDGGVERGQLPLEPLEALDVEVVGRLVEEEQVGVGREGAREGGPGQLAAGERVERPVEVGVAEAEPAEHRCGPVAPRPAARVLEAALRLAVAAQRRRRVVARRHRLLEAGELLLDRDEVARARERVLAQRQPLAARRALVVEGDSGVLGERQLAALQGGLADERAEQGGLARPVRPGERQPVAPAHAERDPVEEGVARELLPEAGGDQDGHDPKDRGDRAARCGRTHPRAPSGRCDRSGREIARLVGFSLVENLGYRQLLAFWRFRAFWDLLRGHRDWGDMRRRASRRRRGTLPPS